MKKGVRILLEIVVAMIILAVILLSIVCCSISKALKNIKPLYVSGENGDFKYRLYTGTHKKFIKLDGLTEEGKKKEIIVVPTEIDGYPVEWLSSGLDLFSSRSDFDFGFIESENLKAIYLPHSKITTDAYETFLDCPNLEKIVYIGVNAFKHTYNLYHNQKIYFPCLDEREEFTDYRYGNVYYANISYYYNYENADNEGFYWVDHFTYGETIGYIPEEPKRTGYTFDGWYKEAECENKWEFASDTLPQAKYDHLGDELMQETKLYAKWIKV